MNEESLFAAVLEKPSAAERLAFLDSACGSDLKLRNRLEKLLAADDSGNGILERGSDAAAVLGVCQLAAPLAAKQGFDQRFTLCKKLGEGGMGEVWVAEQTAPVKRRVALKVMRPGLSTARLMARFDQERQALALMDHPNIGKVFDAGVVDGRPYFVMELIEGASITQYCKDRSLSVRDRVELLIPVCLAVQHAHQKGIIHRDLKPSNLLITLVDGQPVPKVIDFGIAKAIGPRAEMSNASTEVGTLVGTIEYMSPEQAEVNEHDIDTRSDVYSLGVLLYELSTGSVPFTRERLQSVPFAEMLRIIREVDPPHLNDRSALQELNWIAMKCLEKGRNRRYATANDLALDLRRYLSDEPVLAGPPTAGYRVRKFVKRHKKLVVAASVVLLVLIAGIVGTSWGLVAAERSRKAAVANADRAERLADDEKAAHDRAEEQLLRAEWLLYASQINLAQQAWENHHTMLAWRYLNATRADFRGWEHDYLHALFGSIRHETLRGHTDMAYCVAVSGDGKRIVSGSGSGEIRICDTATRDGIRTIKAHDQLVSKVAISADSKRIVSGGGQDKRVKFWDADTGQVLATYDAGNFVNCVALSGDGTRIFAGVFGGMIKAWEVDGGKNSLSFQAHTADVSIALSSDGKRIISGGLRDRTVKVWDAVTGKNLLTSQDSAEVACVAETPDGTRIVSGNGDGTIKIRDATSGKTLTTLRGHHDYVKGVAVSADGKRIVSGSLDMTARIWEIETGRELRVLKGHTSYVNDIAWIATDDRIVTASTDATLRIWEPRDPPAIEPPPGPLVRAAALSLDGKKVATAVKDGEIWIWDRETGKPSCVIERGNPMSTTKVMRLSFSLDGKRLVGNQSDAVKVWDAETGQVLRDHRGHKYDLNWTAIAPDGESVVSAGVDATVHTWRQDGTADAHELSGFLSWHKSPENVSVHIHSLAFGPDARQVIGGRNDGLVQIWNVASGRIVREFKGHTKVVYAADMSRDARRLVTCSADQTAKLWDMTTGDEVLSFTGHTNAVVGVGFLQGGRRVATGSLDKTVKIWDAATGQELLTLKGNLVAVGPDGNRILFSTANGSLQVWDASYQDNAR